MNKMRVVVLMLAMVFAVIVVTQNVVLAEEQNANLREFLDSSQNLDNDDIEAIVANSKIDGETLAILAEELPDDDELTKSLSTNPKSISTKSYIDSDNWQVVRITNVASEDVPEGEDISRYDSSTSEDHGGDWLEFTTVEYAYNPLNDLVTASATFRNRTCTQVDSTTTTSGGYQITERLWHINTSFTSGEIEFEADYAQQITSSIYNTVHLHRELDVE